MWFILYFCFIFYPHRTRGTVQVNMKGKRKYCSSVGPLHFEHVALMETQKVMWWKVFITAINWHSAITLIRCPVLTWKLQKKYVPMRNCGILNICKIQVYTNLIQMLSSDRDVLYNLRNPSFCCNCTNIVKLCYIASFLGRNLTGSREWTTPYKKFWIRAWKIIFFVPMNFHSTSYRTWRSRSPPVSWQEADTNGGNLNSRISLFVFHHF